LTGPVLDALLSSGGGVALAVLVHWHLVELRRELRRMADRLAVLVKRDPCDCGEAAQA
jgi:hypothetical protein